MAGDKTSSEILQANERIKHAVAVATTLGNALAIAALGRMGINMRFDLASLSWLVVAVLMLYVASYSLTLLEADK